MKWSEEYATGIEDLDEQHRMLFQMSEDYRAALDEGRGQNLYGLFLSNLDMYARAHFGIEEQCMYRYQCPVAQANSEAHGQFDHAIDGFKHRFGQQGFSHAEAQRLVEFVDGWLAAHIAGIDVQLRSCVS